MPLQNPETCVALLRGINVGGHKKVPMPDLRKAFEDMGFENVRTVLATGNVIFQAAASKNTDEIFSIVAPTLEDRFGFPIPVLLRSGADIEKIIEIDPFRALEETRKTKFMVTFLPGHTATSLALPYSSADGAFQILSRIDDTVFSVLDLNKAGSPDIMQFLEKTYGKNITTRTWKTILRIGKA